MSRISNEKRAKYPLKIREGCTEEVCYFCGQGAAMDDYTPAVSAAQVDIDHFLEPFVRVKACMRCWKRIYTVNVVERAHRFNAKKGCMTLRQKEALLGSDDTTKAVAEAVNRYSFGFDPPMIAPLGLNQLGEGSNRYIWNTHTVYREELETLQGGFALQMVGAPARYVELHLLTGLGSGELDSSRIDIYREMLGLPSQYEMIHGTAD